MGCEEEERLLFPSFVFPESFAEAATPGSGGEQKKARQRRRRCRWGSSGWSRRRPPTSPT
ncbi:grassy tillers1 [Zea mays]|uniref:Grassy tillers1 n=1 Tax=Zea mays TaxID=4577 RepID=A0A1D6JSA9_MAIZE|nr:grassy tillers1 [Zea mays]